MKFEELDRQIDQAAERLLSKQAPISQPYSSDPLTADHFMLQKSWKYFKDRIKAIEDQWQEILNAKDEQCRLLKEKSDAYEKRIVELEEDVKAKEMFDERLIELRLTDREDFQKDSHRVKVLWEEERQAFLKTIQQQEDKLAAVRKEAEDRMRTQQEATQNLRNMIARMRGEIDEQSRKQKDIEDQWNNVTAKQNEASESLNLKYDLIRQERDRLAALLAQAESSIRGLTISLDEKGAETRHLQDQIKSHQDDFAHLNERYEILQKEKAAIETMWNQEKAEWRELWERARVSWDKQN